MSNNAAKTWLERFHSQETIEKELKFLGRTCAGNGFKMQGKGVGVGVGKSALRIIQSYYPHVTTVVDAKRDVSAEVTTADCKKSVPRRPNACPVATAFQRLYNGAVISVSIAYLVTGTKATRYIVPPRTKIEAIMFDRHRTFTPGVYDLKAPTVTSKLQPRRYKQSPNRNEKTYPTRKKRRITHKGFRSLFYEAY